MWSSAKSILYWRRAVPSARRLAVGLLRVAPSDLLRRNVNVALWSAPARRFRNAARLKTILGVFAAHGFQSLVARVKLGRFVLDRITSKDLEHLSAPERMRMAFE